MNAAQTRVANAKAEAKAALSNAEGWTLEVERLRAQLAEAVAAEAATEAWAVKAEAEVTKAQAALEEATL